MYDKNWIEFGDKYPDVNGSRSLITVRRKCTFQWQICVLSVMIAFFLGIALGVFVPMIGDQSSIRSNYNGFSNATTNSQIATAVAHHQHTASQQAAIVNSTPNVVNVKNMYEVSFVTNNHKNKQKDFEKEWFKDKVKVPIRKASGLSESLKYNKKDSVIETNQRDTVINQNYSKDVLQGIIMKDIYWGELIESALPKGFHMEETNNWSTFVQTSVVTKLELGCGRMQNRLVIFQDGQKACARYRQNTDQIQGELFSFYLGQLLNLSNVVPSAASLVDVTSKTWELASQDIANAQWKSIKPVILTKWLPELEPAGIPMPFQSFERHLNKMDILNITKSHQESIKTLKDPKIAEDETRSSMIHRFTELAQWSDLIVFDYLIANLDRVVNNLYNFQWNADMMSAPAHNLARLKDTQLLVFLDNESGLLHGYRLLKKYEAYHGLLLNNLCIFRWSTIDALQRIRTQGVGRLLQRLYDSTNADNIKDVLPTLPEKSIKILNDRIDRVLTQVQKCQELFAS